MFDIISDYQCRTVGEGVCKYDIPDNWLAEFTAYDKLRPRVCTQVDHIRKTPAMMELKIRIIENQDDESAACIVDAFRKTIRFKIDHMSDLVKAIEPE